VSSVFSKEDKMQRYEKGAGSSGAAGSISWTRSVVGLAALFGIAALIVFVSPSRSALTKVHGKKDARPTIVLVHGAWANNASWSGEIKRLQAAGYTVDAPPNPLLSLNGDSQTIADFLGTIQGPIVLVGHSYGGMVISDAATGNPNVKALVYVDAFVPDQGESALGLDSTQPGSALNAGPPNTIFNFVPYPGAAPGDALTYVKPSVFLQAFANDLPTKEGAVLAATQAPASYSALTAPSGPPAWKTIPSWYVLGTIDQAIPPAIQQFMAERAGADITRVKAGHLSMISQPDAVTKVILEAAQSISG
jgi:pimeloyl-ACP methyl ester carboxylesterase